MACFSCRFLAAHYAHFCMEADRLSVSQGAISV
jgi:hypothetical protein